MIQAIPDQDSRSSRSSAHQAMRAKALPLCLLLLLTGCAGSKVESLAMAPSAPGIAAPRLVRVDVALAPELSADADAGKAAQALSKDLLKRFGDEGIVASTSDATPATPQTATLRVLISQANAGSAAKRMLIGFGAGKSMMRTDTTFEIAGADQAVLTMRTSSNSGRTPGLIVPGGVAASAGNVIPLAIGGGLGILKETTRSGLGGEAERSAKLIVKQTKDLYETEGWIWPSVSHRPA